ncbi:MAG TPA: exosortase C-terminal domain/associated protein EpsI [Candidatus Hypogeohydataceae bacterium YC41]
MKNIDKKHKVLIFILTLSAIFTFFLGHKKSLSQSNVFTKRIPSLIGPWVGGKDLEADARVIEILETDDILTREYLGPKGVTILLCIAFSGESRKAIHPPEVCMSGGGWNLIEKKRLKVPGSNNFEAIKLILEKGDSKQIVLYWYKSGKEFTANFYSQQLGFVKSMLFGGEISCGLIRVSTQIEGQGVEEALSSLTDFAQALMPYLTEGDKNWPQKKSKESS